MAQIDQGDHAMFEGHETGQEIRCPVLCGARHRPNLISLDRHDVEHTITDQPDVTAADLHNDHDMKRIVSVGPWPKRQRRSTIGTMVPRRLSTLRT